MIQSLGKELICLKKYIFLSKKLLISEVGSFLRLSFDLNQICKTVLTQNRYIWNLNANGLLYILIKDSIKALELYKISKKKFRGDQAELSLKIWLLCAILNKMLGT